MANIVIITVCTIVTGKAAVEDVRPRTGTVFTGFCQIVTAVVGAGILALPNAFAALGWIAGPLLLIIFATITYCCSLLLIDCCEHDGERHPAYYYVVKAAFPCSRWPRLSIQVVQQTNLVLSGTGFTCICCHRHFRCTHTQNTGLGYAITAGKALQKVAVVLAPEGTDPNTFYLQTYFWVFMFSCLEMLICQIQTLEELNWVSVLGALVAFMYSVIAIYYGFSYWGTYVCVCWTGVQQRYVEYSHTISQAPTLGPLAVSIRPRRPRYGPSSMCAVVIHSYVHQHCNT